MARLYATIGIPRSSKSTFVNQFLKETPHCQLVCADDIRLALTGQRYNQYVEDHISSIKYTMIRAFLQRGLDVINDATNTTSSSIQKLLRLDPDAIFVWIPSIKHYITGYTEMAKICIDRAIKTNQIDLIPIIFRMAKQCHDLSFDFESGNINIWREEARREVMKIV